MVIDLKPRVCPSRESPGQVQVQHVETSPRSRHDRMSPASSRRRIAVRSILRPLTRSDKANQKSPAPSLGTGPSELRCHSSCWHLSAYGGHPSRRSLGERHSHDPQNSRRQNVLSGPYNAKGLRLQIRSLENSVSHGPAMLAFLS